MTYISPQFRLSELHTTEQTILATRGIARLIGEAMKRDYVPDRITLVLDGHDGDAHFEVETGTS